MNPYAVRKASCPVCGAYQYRRLAPTPCKYADGGMIPALEKRPEPKAHPLDRICDEILRAALATDESILD